MRSRTRSQAARPWPTSPRKPFACSRTGEEIPIQVEGTEDGSLDPSDTITFVGRRNRGTDEIWAYNYDASAQSSTYRSLYSDTTHYWVTWGDASRLRYESASASSTAPTTALRDTARIEQDRYYYFGRPGSTGNPLYTDSEGYYWHRFRYNDTSPISDTYTLPVGRRTSSDASLDLTLRFDAGTSSCHRVEIEGKLLQSDGSAAFETLTIAEWENINRTTVETSIPQDQVPGSGLTLRLTSYNGRFSGDLTAPIRRARPTAYCLIERRPSTRGRWRPKTTSSGSWRPWPTRPPSP